MRASVKRASPDGSEHAPDAAANEEAPAKKLRTMQPDDDGVAAAAADAADEAAAPAETVVTADMQQPAAGEEAAGLNVAPAAVKVEGDTAIEAMQRTAEVVQPDVKMEVSTEAEQLPEASLADAAGTEAEQPKAEEGVAAGQPDEQEQLDEAGEDDEVWCFSLVATRQPFLLASLWMPAGKLMLLKRSRLQSRPGMK